MVQGRELTAGKFADVVWDDCMKCGDSASQPEGGSQVSLKSRTQTSGGQTQGTALPWGPTLLFSTLSVKADLTYKPNFNRYGWKAGQHSICKVSALLSPYLHILVYSAAYLKVFCVHNHSPSFTLSVPVL